MKLFACDVWSEKLATRIAYVSLLARIQSAAAMTSRVIAVPVSSTQREEPPPFAGEAPSFTRSGDQRPSMRRLLGPGGLSPAGRVPGGGCPGGLSPARSVPGGG